MLLLEFLESQNTPENREAFVWFAKDFKAKTYKEYKTKYPENSPGFNSMNQILSGFETAGVLVSHGLLNENLYFDVSGIGFLWPRLEPIVLGAQKEADPSLWENVIWLANRQKWWKKHVWKPNGKWKQKLP